MFIKEKLSGKILRIILIFIILSMALCVVSFAGQSSSSSDDTSDPIYDFDRLNGAAIDAAQLDTADDLYTILGRIIDIITVIGFGIAFIMLIVLGIKYVTESADGKAKIKETMLPYIIGVVVIVAASAILQLVEVIVSTTFNV